MYLKIKFKIRNSKWSCWRNKPLHGVYFKTFCGIFASKFRWQQLSPEQLTLLPPLLKQNLHAVGFIIEGFFQDLGEFIVDWPWLKRNLLILSIGIAIRITGNFFRGLWKVDLHFLKLKKNLHGIGVFWGIDLDCPWLKNKLHVVGVFYINCRDY